MRAINDKTIIDYVDDLDVVQGQMTRKAVVESDKNYRVAHALLFTRDKQKAVLQRLAPTHVRNIHRLGSSAAGFVHAGESYADAISRIVVKELGVQMSNLEPVTKLEMRDGPHTKFIQVFAGTVRSSLKPDPLQVSELVFADFDQLHAKARTHPEEFTSTFRHILSSLGNWRGISAA